jgi:hypothetical protein
VGLLLVVVVVVLVEDMVIHILVKIMAIDGRQPYVTILHWLNHFLPKFNN